jgi:hypothetical protein
MSTGSGAVRPVSLVTYQLSGNPNQQGYLLRSENTIVWTPGSNLNFQQSLTAVPAAGTPSAGPPNDLLSTGIVDFEMIFLFGDGTTVLAKDYQPTTLTASPVVMIGVAVAVIDDGVMTQLPPGAFNTIQKSVLEGALPSITATVNPTTGLTTYNYYQRSIKELWDQQITTLYTNNSYPKSLASGFKTFEQFVPCTPFN